MVIVKVAWWRAVRQAAAAAAVRERQQFLCRDSGSSLGLLGRGPVAASLDRHWRGEWREREWREGLEDGGLCMRGKGGTA